MTRGEARDRTVVMYRVRNEAALIARSLARTWQVARTVVLFDDGSTDDTVALAVRSLPASYSYARDVEGRLVPKEGVLVETDRQETRELHVIYSPFRTANARAGFEVDEVRDKNTEWAYVKSQLDFDYVLCLDGDEMLSNQAVREWGRVIGALEHEVDQLALSFVYLWDREDRRRCDPPLYAPVSAGGAAAHLRAFTVKRMAPLSLFKSRFEYFCGKCHTELAERRRAPGLACNHPGAGRAGLHCGSIPTKDFWVLGAGGAIKAPAFGRLDLDDLVIHYGYMDAAQRERKFEWYNLLDPGNDYEGRYEHIRGGIDQWAPGGVKLAPWEDK